jgi:sugar lactone lactonase YvrE
MFRFLSIVITISALTACAANSTTPYAAEATGSARMSASGCGKSVVYVTSYNNSVYIYDQKHNSQSPCGQITGVTNPQGLFVDKKGNLWVAVSGNCRTQFSSVLEFAPGNATPVRTLQDSAGDATDVAVDNASGTVYVTNFFDYSEGCASGNNGAVEVYANGSTSPTSTLTDPNMTYAINDAVDDKGNLYVTYLNVNGSFGTGRIDEWSGGSGAPTDLDITLQAPGGIQTTANGALLVCDQSVACGDFDPGSTTMTNLFATKTPGSFGVALDKHEKHAWVENSSASTGQLQQYKYPGPAKRAKQTIVVPGGGYAGVAVSPAAHEGAPY